MISTDFLNKKKAMIKTLQIPVAEVMSRDLLIVKPEDTLDKVGEIFATNNIHHLPVVDSEGTLKGILSKSDFVKVNHMFTLFNKEKYESYNKKLRQAVQVHEVMTTWMATLDPNDPLSIAVGIFQENLFHALPVVDNGRLVGLLTTHDLINYCCSEVSYLEKREE
jgi:CBS domain-containing protein